MNLTVGGFDKYPLRATDIQIVENNEVRNYTEADWDNNKHKLLIFIPEAFTPVCQTELGAIRHWHDEFAKLNCELIAVASETPHRMLDWYKEEETLNDLPGKTFTTYLLPNRLGLVNNGRVKRSSVFIMQDGEVVKQEHFEKVGRSFAELHRMLYGYTTDSYCAEGWNSPEDGFLKKGGE